MNKRWNRKKWLSLVFWALSVASLWFWLSGWEYFAYKIPLTLINGFDWFMLRNFNLLHATSDILFYGPLILSATLLLLALYFWIMVAKQAYDNEETDTLSIIFDTLVYLFLFFVFAIFFLICVS